MYDALSRAYVFDKLIKLRSIVSRSLFAKNSISVLLKLIYLSNYVVVGLNGILVVLT